MKNFFLFEYEKNKSGIYIPASRKNKTDWGVIGGLTAAIVAISGFLGYALALVHELGYTSLYKIPIEFIKLDQTSVLYYSAATLLLFFLFLVTFFVWILIHYSKLNKWWDLLGYVNVIFISTALYASAKNYLFGGYAPYVTIVLLLLQIILLKKLEGNSNDSFEVIKSKILKGAALFVIWLLTALFVLAYTSGSTDALNEKHYLVPSTDNNSVVIRIYGENAICAPLSANNSSLLQKFFIIKINEPGLVFRPRIPEGHIMMEQKPSSE